ncbi:putative Pleiotropic ABC efflux transporter of multiple drugs [Glarea lozoyensis 74030]|uniref:Putative Pleiotropic ABC efflux transporter of multiple drugs n=1 Tax=Glarea lozoyensis (strain ATCC 74030 / MF5533) TaxID=1104152 RepID=H0EFV5_GLAL7|nr:putative Pleiotropic ABC efflux transporter of multiple drugs [Glarea lozoyensis 74030]
MAQNSGTVLLLMWVYMMYMTGVELAGMAGNYANLLFMLTLIFCGILVKPDALPGFWTFMYRVSPFTYLVGAILSTGLAGAHVRCADIELLHFDPTPGNTCKEYMKSFIQTSMGYLTNPDATEACAYCPLDTADGFLRSFGIKYEDQFQRRVHE